jgi:hypothetical protein
VPDPVVLRDVVVPATELLPLPVLVGAGAGGGVETTGAGVGAGVKLDADVPLLVATGVVVVVAGCTGGVAATGGGAGLARCLGLRSRAGGCCVRDSPASLTEAGVTPGAAFGGGAAA